jgi:hypothetical protein
MKKVIDDKSGRTMEITERAGYVEARYSGHRKVRVFANHEHSAINCLRFLAGAKTIRKLEYQ